MAFTVDDADAVRARHAEWTGRGLTIAQPPTELDFGHTFVALDPDGHRLRVFAPSARGPRVRRGLDALVRPWLDDPMFPAPSYPTPVRALTELRSAHAEVWLKNDGLSHPVYGGNKVRKAQRLVAEAIRRGAPRVLSFGAAGSHHLLTLTLFARAAGLESAAVVFPQPRTDHAAATLRAALAAGLRVYPARQPALIPGVFARAWQRADYVVAPGGSNRVGAGACADAVLELERQITLGELPCPDVIVVPLGSGGTCGGLAAGVVSRGLRSSVLGVQVVAGVGPRVTARWLARSVLRAAGKAQLANQLGPCIRFDSAHVGPGYGAPSQSGIRALAIAAELGLELDQTYTAKAFAKVLELAASAKSVSDETGPRPLRILYWHTLAATPLEPLLRDATNEEELPSSIRQLLR